jgi:hypothetical protein
MGKRLSSIAPTWLLLPADICHNKYFQTSGLADRCQKIVSVGRVRWIPDSPRPGKDNCAWMLFDKRHSGKTEFYARAA